MKIVTSYYARIARNPQNLIPVRVSTSEPSWFPFICESISELYPGWDLVNEIKSGKITWLEYTTRYKAKLASLDRNAILQRLNQISAANGNRDIVLLCYENPRDNCHRHLIAEWLGPGIQELE